ncbi:hypothetical protein [Alistipes senegalensis]|nr:hypothetical protein [Alistipes senegalensis]
MQDSIGFMWFGTADGSPVSTASSIATTTGTVPIRTPWATVPSMPFM